MAAHLAGMTCNVLSQRVKVLWVCMVQLNFVGVVQLNFVGIHNLGQLHQQMVLQVLPHQQTLSHFWRQTAPQAVGLLQRQTNNNIIMMITVTTQPINFRIK